MTMAKGFAFAVVTFWQLTMAFAHFNSSGDGFCHSLMHVLMAGAFAALAAETWEKASVTRNAASQTVHTDHRQ